MFFSARWVVGVNAHLDSSSAQGKVNESADGEIVNSSRAFPGALLHFLTIYLSGDYNLFRAGSTSAVAL